MQQLIVLSPIGNFCFYFISIFPWSWWIFSLLIEKKSVCVTKCMTYLLPQTVAMALKQPDASW